MRSCTKTAKTARISCRWLNVHSAVQISVISRCLHICEMSVITMSDITDMVDDILQDNPQQLRGFVAGDCLYLEAEGNQNAWIEGKSVVIGDWQ